MREKLDERKPKSPCNGLLSIFSQSRLDLKIVTRKISILRLLEEFMFLFFPKYLFHFVTQRLTH